VFIWRRPALNILASLMAICRAEADAHAYTRASETESRRSATAH
jgi:hypothetical protein